MLIPGYTITDTIGSGGMATVYKGTQDSLNREVAIKVIHQQLTNHSMALQLFERESYIIARLNHPHIIHIIDRGLLEDKTPYFIMEYLQGMDLAKLTAQGELSHKRKLEILIQVCKALGYAHRNGVIHRDIKPANILIDNEGHAHVLDFGIARFCGSHAEQGKEEALVGTLAYMAPEQRISADNVTPLSDIYSLGVLMFVLCTGQKPQAGEIRPSTLASGIEPALDQLILQCLRLDPKLRPTSADEVKDGLLKIVQGTHLNQAQKERAEQGVTKLKNKFVVLDIIKEERHGAVYLYQNRSDQSLLVIKKRPVWSKGWHESNMIKALTHPHIVKIYGTSKNERMFIIVLEYMNGGSLRDRMIVPLEWGEALKIMRQVCQGVVCAHQHQVVHGNLRPTNILFDQYGRAKVADFGLDEHYREGVEQNWYKLRSEEKTKRTDIFSIGVILYEMITGVLPRWKNKKIVDNDVFDGLPESLQKMLLTMLSLSSLSRQKSIKELVEQIDDLLVYHQRLLDEEVQAQKWAEQKQLEQEAKRLAKIRRRQLLNKVLLMLGVASALAVAGLYHKGVVL